MSDRAPNQRDVAKAAGVSSGTVSLALRNHPSIPPSTRERIRAVAAEIGYTPNLRVAEVMRHIRRNRASNDLKERVAMLWADTDADTVQADSNLSTFEQTVREVLHRNGIGLDVYYHDTSLPFKRVERVLRSTGVRGVLLAPLMHDARMDLDWDWERFSVVTAGSADWKPGFNRVRFNHFAEMNLLVRHLLAEGCKRIGLTLLPDLDERSQHAVLGGFWASLPAELRSPDVVYEHQWTDKKGFLSWMKRVQPDGLILGDLTSYDWVKDFRSAPHLVLRARQEMDASVEIAGIVQDYARLGEVAAEQLVSQLLIHQFGIPEDPVQSLITGKLS